MSSGGETTYQVQVDATPGELDALTASFVDQGLGVRVLSYPAEPFDALVRDVRFTVWLRDIAAGTQPSPDTLKVLIRQGIEHFRQQHEHSPIRIFNGGPVDAAQGR